MVEPHSGQVKLDLGSDFLRERKTNIVKSKMIILCVNVLLLGLFSLDLQAQNEGAKTIRVMTFNLWRGGLNGGQPLVQSIKAIELAQADIVGLQETHHGDIDNGKKIAAKLGWHYFQQGGRTAVLSRYPIVGSTTRKWGVKIQLPSKTTLHFFNAHFPASPYQPYQILKIPYGDAPFISTSHQAVEWALKSRGAQVDSLLQELIPTLQAKEPVVLTGDFNEPSFQDWTQKAADKKLVPLAVPYPTTKQISEAGMRDTYRTIHPDEIKERGHTWTNTTTPGDPNDFHDRIDFVFVKNLTVQNAQVVGESTDNADIVLTPWPSDHRGVVAKVAITLNDDSFSID